MTTETYENLPILRNPYPPEVVAVWEQQGTPREQWHKTAPLWTARVKTAKSEHILCNPPEVIREALRQARESKTPAVLTQVFGWDMSTIELNPAYIISVEYLPVPS